MKEELPRDQIQSEHSFTRRGLVGVGAGVAVVGLGGAAFGLKSRLSPSAVEAAQSIPSHEPKSAQRLHSMAATPEATATAPPTPFNGVSGQPLIEPVVRASSNGVLETTLEAKLGPATVAGQPVTSFVYEGSFPGPTLSVKPGETLKVKLVNGLTEHTNIHTHGFHVSPKDNSDNIFIQVTPGETFDYEYKLPANHAPGIYWYHPHGHTTSAVHCNGGMGGVILVEGGLDELPGIKGLTSRVLALQVTQFDGDGNLVPYNSQSNLSKQRFVNGQLNPTISIRPGETQRWRIANISSDNFVLLALTGHELNQIASDGNPMDVVLAENQILVAPSERIEVLVQASSQTGNYELRSITWGPGFQAEPDGVIATMVIEGEAMTPAPLPTTLIPYVDLRGLTPDVVRVTTFEEPGPPLYLAIDGKHFDPNRVDQTVKLGATEEWVVRNTSPEWHPFHIHVNDFQVISVNGDPYDAHGYEDTVPLPPNSETVIRTQFLDYAGKFVYHCHILGHEDFGMMAVVEVVE